MTRSSSNSPPAQIPRPEQRDDTTKNALTSSRRRLHQILNTLAPNPPPPRVIGTLKLGDVSCDIFAVNDETRTPRLRPSIETTAGDGEGKEGETGAVVDINERGLGGLLGLENPWTLDNLRWMLQKYLLGQDIFLVSQPGSPYARRLALTFARLINAEYEYIALHRDVGETELKQGREIRTGGNLVYVDSPAVSAVKHGRLLILEGIEKAERGIMPVLNNLLENREMNLDDGSHIVHPHRYAQLDSVTQKTDNGQITTFIPAHKNFRIIAIAAPVPPYPGYPLDPPFRSRFQARFIDPVASSIALCTALSNAILIPTPRSPQSTDSSPQREESQSAVPLYDKLRDIILSTQYASESESSLQAVSKSALSPFPQTALSKLHALLSMFPPATSVAPTQLSRLFLAIHPGLVYAPFQAWALLSRQCAEAGLEGLGSPTLDEDEHEQETGFLGYILQNITRVDNNSVEVTFVAVDTLPKDTVLAGDGVKLGLAGTTSGSATPKAVTCVVTAGPRDLMPYPFRGGLPFYATHRFVASLTSIVQAHALGWDISLIPPPMPSTSSTSTTTLVTVFADILGYELETLHLYKELGGRELVMRRKIGEGGATSWEPSPLIEGALTGKLVHLAGLDVLGATGGSLARLVHDREMELWEKKRIVASASTDELTLRTTPTGVGEGSKALSVTHPSFRIITTASKSLPLKDWLTAEHANMFFSVPSQPMDFEEESTILLATGCPPSIVEVLLNFADRYRRTLSASIDSDISLASLNREKGKEAGQPKQPAGRRWRGGSGGSVALRHRKLGTRTLVRIARRMGQEGEWQADDTEDLSMIIARMLLLEFLPPTERRAVEDLVEGAGISSKAPPYYPDPVIHGDLLVFPGASRGSEEAEPTTIPRFDVSDDPEGVASHVPHMDHFYDNSLQTGLMREVAIDLEILGEHVVLLGNQGVGKNKIVDRLCQLLGRPREYIQLHRDTTVNQLMFTTTLSQGVINYADSPLLRAIIYGRVIIIDEADKAPEHVVAIFRSLAGQGELTLSDGRKVRRTKEQDTDIIVHPNFRLILLANRPGYPFLGNHFLQVLGENFSAHSVTNPDLESERKLLAQLAPELDEDIILRLVGAFHDLRSGYESGMLNYPYSLRELINLVRHMQAFPKDSLDMTLRNIFDFDVYKTETIDKLAEILEHHGLHVRHLGAKAAREDIKKIEDVTFELKSIKLDKPKEGKHDDKDHHGGNTWAGGTGGRDTAGLGGIGGYKRLWKGGEIKQVSDAVKDSVPDHVKEKAREMARQELQRRLEELDMSVSDAKGYDEILKNTHAHMLALHDLLEHLAAKEEERVWIKRQTDGELDDSRLTEGLTGESTVYKRRGMEKPELGRPQMKPKRIRFIFDLSASMYRFQYDGRLKRSLETAAMLMETFNRLSRKEKYVWDMYGHSGDGPNIALVEADKPPTELRDRWKILEKMNMIPQYTFSGDHTVDAIIKGVTEVGKYDADDWFVIIITDANFSRYQITPEEVTGAMNRDPKVQTALICIGEGAEAVWIPKSLPRRGFRVKNTADIPVVLRSILTTMVDR
ncbi:hypothetical protein BDN72DRAFT_838036 [Pluteus cervinus]|uniref:Uncharacterized protein n=1 Tax=Pluteus cervinus TaxID=181527 RepID=A0ACD3B1L7_9AGAR|nr:hypothetical protein BDN72DRAFT_838036 [Pluteus cervinus]